MTLLTPTRLSTADSSLPDPDHVLQFWFEPSHQSLWFARDDDFDQKIRSQFASVHQQASLGELWSWRRTVEGRLAEIIVLDQFSRNLYRDQPQAFAQDGMALVLAQEAIHRQLDQQLDPVQRRFLYMPLMHSESRQVHQFAYVLFQRLGHEDTFNYEKRHKAIIDEYGRYPHRNAILGRPSTDAELVFLQQPNAYF